MPVTDITTDPENLTMTLIADVDASVDRLWRAFTQPEQLERFWGPPGWPATFTEFSFAPGGRARYHMTSPQGEASYGAWEFLKIDEPDSFEVLDAWNVSGEFQGVAVDQQPDLVGGHLLHVGHGPPGRPEEARADRAADGRDHGEGQPLVDRRVDDPLERN